MKSNLFDKHIELIKNKTCDAIFLCVSNEHLYEFTKIDENIINELVGFTGDTASLLITEYKSYLYVDGRFTVQAKKEIKNKNIKIIEINKKENIICDLCDRLSINDKLMLDYKKISAETVFNIKENLKNKNIRFAAYNENLVKQFVKAPNKIGEKEKNLQELFLLKQKYVSKTPKIKIKELFDKLENNFKYYITSNLEEIAYITNIRKYPDMNDSMVLPTAFIIASKEHSALYIKENINASIQKYLMNNNIEVKKYDDFYYDLTLFANKSYAIDPKINNYYIIKKLHIKNKFHFIKSPLNYIMSIKGPKEIEGLKLCNLLDGIAITKAIYEIKDRIKNGEKLSEFDIANIVDEKRKITNPDYYVSKSFETIVAFNENAAICHYAPERVGSKIVSKNGILLIDSGGNYICGTTDITRTISLYNNKVPKIIKRHYTLVLNALIKLAVQKFPYGLTGSEIDIVSRAELYNKYLDFKHGTGHGIGYVSNVHEGPNRIGPGIVKDYKENILEPCQLTSDEPGLYFEDKYGIRLENDLLTSFDKETQYGDFLKFETLTLCPFDRDMIDENLLTDDSIKFLNIYNREIYKKLYNKLDKNEKKWLKYDTKQFKRSKK